MPPQTFDKYEGLGNDFIVVRAPREDGWSSSRVRKACDRHFGIGADGVLLVLPALGAGRARMRVLNADGSIPEMCGNGLRCVAKALAKDDGRTGECTLLIETDAGIKECILHENGEVTAQMGEAIVGEAFEVVLGDERFSVTPVSVGNPHAVIFDWGGGSGTESAKNVGPRVSARLALRDGARAGTLFATGANVEFARTTGTYSMDVDVWERGVGVTLACGTGACAAVAAAHARGRVMGQEGVRVRLPGGELTVHVLSNGRIAMRGPARHVFSGTLEDTYE